MRFILIFSFLSYFVFIFPLKGQQITLTHVEQEFSFQPYADASGKICNELLQYISEGNGRLRAYTSFSLKGSLLAELDTTNSNKSVNLKISNVNFSGDILYKDFSLSRIIMPDRANIRLHFNDQAGDLIHDTLLQELKIPAKGGSFFTTAVSCQGTASVVPVYYEFYYSPQTLDRFQGWFKALEEYYAAGRKLKEIGEIISKLDYLEPERVLLQEFDLCQAEDMFYRIQNASFHQWIDLKDSDPENILYALKLTETEIKHLRRNFNHSVASVDSLYYEKGKQLLEKNDTVQARKVFLRALAYNPFHIKTNLAIAQTDLLTGDKESALQRMGNLIGKMYPDGEEKQLSLKITNAVLDSFFVESRRQTWDRLYLSALKTLAPVEKFCLQVKDQYQCPAELNLRLIAAHTGMYRSFLTVANRARTGDNLSFALTYIDNAIEYHHKNSEYISGIDEAVEQLQYILNRYFEIGLVNMGLKNYKQASLDFGKAYEMLKKYPNLVFQQDIEYYLAESIRLKDYIPEGKTRGEHNFNLPEMRQEVREVLLEQLSQGHLKAWAGEVEEARQILSEVSTISMMHKLNGDTLINHRLTTLSQKIIEKECQQAQKKFSYYISESFRCKDLKTLPQAARYAAKALSIIDLNPQCTFLGKDSLKMLSDLIPAGKYLEMIENARKKYDKAENNNYNYFIEEYLEAELLYNENSLSEMGIKHTELYSFIAVSDNLELVNQTIVYMSRCPQKYLGSISMLLESLREKGVSQVELQHAQKIAGQMFASHLSADNSGETHNRINQLIGNDESWYSVLRESFNSSRNK